MTYRDGEKIYRKTYSLITDCITEEQKTNIDLFQITGKILEIISKSSIEKYLIIKH